MNQLRGIVRVALVICMLAFSCNAKAQVAADFQGELQNGFQANLTLGWSFEVHETIVIDGLGFFDDHLVDGHGLLNDHRVGLWGDEETPQLLAETVITNASESRPSSADAGNWMFNDIEPLVLQPGFYIIGAHDPACSGPDCDRHRMFTNSISIAEISLLQGRSGQGYGAPQSPQDVTAGYFGPTFRVANVVTATSMDVTRGTLASGSIRQLRYSDDSDVSVFRSSTDVMSATEIELTSISPFESPSRMSIAVEASVFARGAVTQTCELYDYQLGGWEIVGSQPASRFVDNVMTADATPNLQRFVEPNTNEMKLRVRFQSTNPRQSFGSNIDYIYWNIGE